MDSTLPAPDGCCEQPIMALNDGTRNAQLIWELAQHCDVLLDDKRKLISHCRRTLEWQDDLRKMREPAEANLLAANEHLRLKIIGLMADLGNINGERDEMDAARKKEVALNAELRAELSASLEEKTRVDASLEELTQQISRQIDERDSAILKNAMLSEKIKELDSHWQATEDEWVAEKNELVKRSSESRHSDLEEIAGLRKSYAKAENNVTQFKQKTEEMSDESDQLREERDKLKAKATSLSKELATMQAALEDKKAENAKVRNEEYEALAERDKEVSIMQLAITRLEEEKETYLRASRRSESEELDATLKYENKSSECRQMELQYKNMERITREMEKQLTDVKRAYSKLEETLRRQSVDFEKRVSETSSILTKRDQTTEDVKGKLQHQPGSPSQISDTEVSAHNEEKVKPEVGAGEERNDGNKRLIHASAPENDASTVRLKSFSNLFQQLEAGFEQMPNWLSFQAEFFRGEKALSPEELSTRFLKFLNYTKLEIAELEDSLVTTVEENAGLKQFVADSKVAFEDTAKTAETNHVEDRKEIARLMDELSTAKSERDAQKRVAHRRGDKLKRIKEMILLWINQQELGQLADEKALGTADHVNSYPTFQQIIKELSSS